jgi:hypothetical protein
MRCLAAAVLVALVASQAGCAAVFDGTKQTVRITSDPPADIRRSGGSLGTTPRDLEIDRQQASTLTLHRDGYEEAQIRPRQQAQAGWFVWDIVTCVIPVTLCLPVLVDAVTGAWFSYEDEYAVKLVPQQAPPPPPPQAQLPPPGPPMIAPVPVPAPSPYPAPVPAPAPGPARAPETPY